MKPKRSQQKRVTREAQVVRYLRQSKGLSLTQAGALVSISGSAIAHIEQGRMDLSLARARTLVETYGYTWGEFMEYVDGRDLPLNYRDECLRLLNDFDSKNLQTIYQVLVGFTSSR